MPVLRNGVNTSTKQADQAAKRDAVIKQLYKDSLEIYWSKVSLAKVTELITRYTDAGLPVPTILTDKLQYVISQLPTNQCLYSSQAELEAQAKAGPNCHSVRVQQLSDLPKSSLEYFQSLPNLSFQQKLERMRESELAELQNPPTIHRAPCVDLAVEEAENSCTCQINDKWADEAWYKIHAASGACRSYKPWI
jgi:hypothetical protein